MTKDTKDAKKESIMRKVNALLAKAGSTGFDAERDALLAKADEMMAAYAIEQFELDMARPAGERARPVVEVIEHPNIENYELRSRLHVLFYSLARHVGVMIGDYRYMGGNDCYKVVGYRSDIDWLEMLYTNIQLHMLSRMEPKPDTKLTETENFIMLRESGMDYKRIFQLMGLPWLSKDGSEVVGHGDLGTESTKKLRTLRKAYHDQCKAEGRPPVKGLKAETYRESFLQGYVDRITQRLSEMKRARDAMATGHALVLASRDDDLKEAFYDAFPDRRPHPDNCECDTCHFTKCIDEKCTRPRCVEWNKNKNKPVKYRAPRKVKEDASAYALGQRVAETADLGKNDKVSGTKGALK